MLFRSTRGMDKAGAEQIASWIASVLSSPSEDNIQAVRSQVESYMPSLVMVPDILGV